MRSINFIARLHSFFTDTNFQAAIDQATLVHGRSITKLSVGTYVRKCDLCAFIHIYGAESRQFSVPSFSISSGFMCSNFTLLFLGLI